MPGEGGSSRTKASGEVDAHAAPIPLRSLVGLETRPGYLSACALNGDGGPIGGSVSRETSAADRAWFAPATLRRGDRGGALDGLLALKSVSLRNQINSLPSRKVPDIQTDSNAMTTSGSFSLLGHSRLKHGSERASGGGAFLEGRFRLLLSSAIPCALCPGIIANGTIVGAVRCALAASNAIVYFDNGLAPICKDCAFEVCSLAGVWENGRFTRFTNAAQFREYGLEVAEV